MADRDNAKYILQSVSNTLDLLNILAAHDNVTVQELSDLSGFGKSSVFRMLATLENKQFVRRSEDARYSLDLQLAYLGDAVMNRIDIVHYGHSFIERLSDQTGETTHLAVLYKDTYVRFVDKVVGKSTIHMDSHLGFQRYAHLVSAGKAILAFSPPEKLALYVQKADFTPLTPSSISSPEELQHALIHAQQVGFTSDLEESEPGLVCYAAPIFDMKENVIAAVSISGPAQRMRDNYQANIEMVVCTAKDITNSMR